MPRRRAARTSSEASGLQPLAEKEGRMSLSASRALAAPVASRASPPSTAIGVALSCAFTPTSRVPVTMMVSSSLVGAGAAAANAACCRPASIRADVLTPVRILVRVLMIVVLPAISRKSSAYALSLNHFGTLPTPRAIKSHQQTSYCRGIEMTLTGTHRNAPAPRQDQFHLSRLI